jgi:hypothetical protein
VTVRALSWLTACVRAFIALRRATPRAWIISTAPSPDFGVAVAVPACTARAAASASTTSDAATAACLTVGAVDLDDTVAVLP